MANPLPDLAPQGKKSAFMRFLDVVERVGNKLPHPFILFVYLALLVMVVSAVVSAFGVTVVHPGTQEEVAIKSLISTEGLRYIIDSMLDNFTGFRPLGLVLAMMLGIGLAQQVGLVQTFMRKTILNAPRSLVTYAVLFTGVIGNLASDAALVIVPPLAAMVFYALGRHPLAGLAAGFAGAGAGFTANIFIAGTDALLSGISTEVAQTIDPNLVVTPVDNWYFMSFSVLMLMVVGAFVTEKIIEPKLGKYEGNVDKGLEQITEVENRGLRNALIAGLIYLGLVSLLVLPSGAPLRNEEGGLVPSPFLNGIVPIIFLFFVTVAVAYGVTVGKIKESKDIPQYMGEAMKQMSGYIVLIFAAAQFIAYFNWSNLGIWIAVTSAEFLQSMNMTGVYVVVGFTLLTALLNLFIFSGSAQWALMAPIFVPMFMLLDYHPAFVQLAYRIGDSSTNIITPLNPYILVVLAFMREYAPKAGFGTLFSLMLPYTLFFLGAWIVIFLIWSLLGLPIVPGVGMSLH
ncbi:AbgT family transporter [Caldalkalibacillus thermarum TA2.A1]|uniref:AbgT family transporter n=1 Tax=Caldalkalibacillus thermarum (strain TA2.A1) TaxID=986075 RepID=A0A8X8L7D7_CALTT|nr:AbgT family transporter [Caldalkalibacillus thermarum]QZT34132.1 AbgT family transporter [Caldalkalibacillus thermarum TA2.A1]